MAKINRISTIELIGHPIPLEVDHIDSNARDNHPNNWQLICINCHSQTPTYKAKNKGNGRSSRGYHIGESNGQCKAKERLLDPTKNSQYVTCWVYHDTLGNKKIKNQELSYYLSLGYIKGRKIKN